MINDRGCALGRIEQMIRYIVWSSGAGRCHQASVAAGFSRCGGDVL